MRVIHLSTTVSGGAGRAALRSVDALNFSGVEAILFSRVESREILSKKDKFSELKVSRLSSTSTILQRFLVQNSDELITTCSIDMIQKSREIRDFIEEFDVIHLHASYNFFSPEKLLAWFRNKPIAITLHDQRLLTGGCHYSTYCKGLYSNCTSCPKVRALARSRVEQSKMAMKIAITNSNKQKLHLVAPSQWMKSQIELVPEYTEVSSSVVYNCIPNSFFTDSLRFGNEKESLRVGIVATDLSSPYKGFDFFLRGILNFIRLRGISIEVVLVTNGTTQTIKRKGLEIKTVCPKDDSDYLSTLDSLDVVCVPSTIDNSPNVITEALARGVMVVASNSGGTGEIPDILGISTFTYGDIDDFCKVLAKSINHRRITNGQHQLLRTVVSEESHALDLQTIYKSMI
jgi:glycosyltransferase involved in cell wall biosynthesis